MTVSRVINNQQNVKPETRARVLQAIKELGYQPNAAARALNRQKVNAIGVVFPYSGQFLALPYFTELLLALELCISERGYDLMIRTANVSSDNKANYLSLYRQRKVDGLLLVAPSEDDEEVNELLRENIPFVLINARLDHEQAHYIDVDNLRGAELAVQYLSNLGHRRIGMLTGLSDRINSRHRLEGYLCTMTALHGSAEMSFVYEGDFTEQVGREALPYFLSLNDPPTAIFCANDQIALGVLNAAHEQHIRVPDELSVIGFDDMKFASFFSPPLTTIRQKIDDIGRLAGQLIIDIVEGCITAPQKIILAPQLIVRSSCRNIKPL
jgi:LacI family transcriptional regulator, repressor for deo operon, udp, cdd, tsx, nupC, and nupG